VPSLDPVTQRFIADVIPYLEAMDELIAKTEEATLAVEALQAAINGLDGKTVLINVKTVGGGAAGDVTAQVAQVKDLAVAWTEAEAAQAAETAAAEAFGRDVAAAAAATNADAAATRNLSARLAEATANIERFDRYAAVRAQSEATQVAITDANISADERYAASLEVLRGAYRDAFDQVPAAVAAEDALRASLQAADTAVAFNAVETSKLAQAFLFTNQRVNQIRSGVDRANQGWAVQIGWLRLTATALHWIVAGSAEFLAVAVPAAVALGAGLLVAAQGAQNAQQHFSALYAATESTYSAFHQTVGSVLGLGSALQNAQNAANPGVYTILGSVVNDAKSKFADFASMGLQVVHMLDEFSARITVDLKGALGAQLHGLLAGAVTDLQRFGNVLGNLGHALLNFASAMPGLAQVLLNIAVGISDVIEWASRAGALLTFAIAMEEVFRWGGLLLGLLARLAGAGGLMNAFAAGGGFIARFGAAIKALVVQGGVAIGWIGQMIGKLGALSPAAAQAGAALENAGRDVSLFGAELSTGMIAGVTLAIAAFAALAFAISHVKDGMQQLAANAVTAVRAAGDLQVFGVAAAQLAKLAPAISQTDASMARMSSTSIVLAGAVGNASSSFVPLLSGFAGLGKLTAGIAPQIAGVATGLSRVQGTATGLAGELLSLWPGFAGATTATTNLGALNAAAKAIVGTINTVYSNTRLLAGAFHTTGIGALELANAAGVNLQVGLTKGSEAMKIAVQQINNLKTGLGAMSAPAGVIGADMTAIGIQSQLASSKVQTVNQALDAFIAGTTGGMTTVMQFNAALHTMGNDAISSSVGITGAINSISRSAAKIGYTLQGIGPHAQQSWQQFDAAVQQGNSILDTFRIGMAEGVVSAGQYNNEIRAVGGALLPFAAHNRTALAIVSQLSQEMGNPATHNLRTLASQFGITGRAAQNMATVGMERAIAGMANMNVVARNLSVTVGSQLDAAMSSAITKFSGVQTAAANYAKALSNASTPASVLAKAQAAFNTAMQNEGRMTATATGDINKHAGALGGLAPAYKAAATGANGMDAAVKQSSTTLMTHAVSAKAASLASQNFGQQARTAGSAATGLATNANQANSAVKTLGTSANVTRGSLGTVNNEIRTTAGAASASQGPLSGMSNNIRMVGSSALAAAGEVRGLESAIASLQSKTITITTNMVTNTIHRAGGGPVAAGLPYTVGEFGRELFVPGTTGYIVPHEQTQQILSPVASPATTAQIGGGGAGGGTAVIHNHVYLDGQQIWNNQQQTTLRYNVRNGNRGSGVVAPVSAARG